MSASDEKKNQRFYTLKNYCYRKINKNKFTERKRDDVISIKINSLKNVALNGYLRKRKFSFTLRSYFTKEEYFFYKNYS